MEGCASFLCCYLDKYDVKGIREGFVASVIFSIFHGKFSYLGFVHSNWDSFPSYVGPCVVLQKM